MAAVVPSPAAARSHVAVGTINVFMAISAARQAWWSAITFAADPISVAVLRTEPAAVRQACSVARSSAARKVRSVATVSALRPAIVIRAV